MVAKPYSSQTIQQAWDLIQKAQKITLLTHQNPDADGISACAALDLIFAKMGKTVEAVYPTKPEFPLTRQPRMVHINTHTQIPDLIIALDTANYARLYYPEMFKSIPLINIDHHVSSNINGTCNLLNPVASSTCEELFLLIKQWAPDMIDQAVAECLLFGMLYDTQVFHTQATKPYTLRIAAELMDYGANVFDLKNELLANKSPKIIALWGRVLSNIQISPSGNAAWATITQKDLKAFDVMPVALVGFSNFLWEIGGVDITAVFYETETGKSKISLRSKTSDVNALANKFGGGGHKNASGITSDKPLQQLISEITKLF